MNMNISTGGAHILFFERDSSLMALLISEFQLAGYECHTARTAVEVFDAIARHPIRVALVNVAQAAAGRREFWVALDTQRRGRGVQVFTYRCYNLAGYGPREMDERSQGVAVDMEIDGMLGLMNLVERIRERVPATPVATGTIPRFSRTTSPASPSYAAPTPMNGEQQSYSEKIRAVLSSNPRPASPQVSETINGVSKVSQATSSVDTSSPQRSANVQVQREPRESGLAQLSRMVQEYQPSLTEEVSTTFPLQVTDSISSQPLRASPIEDLPLDRVMTGSTAGETIRRGETGTRAAYRTNGQSGPGYGTHQETTAPTPLASITAAMPVTSTVPDTPSIPSSSPVQPSQSHQTSATTFTAPARPTVPIPAVTVTTPLAVVKQTPVATQVQEPQQVRQEAATVAAPEKREVLEEQVTNEAEQAQSEEVQEAEEVGQAAEAQENGQIEASDREEWQRRDSRDTKDNQDNRQEVLSQEIALADVLQSLPASSTPSSVSPASSAFPGSSHTSSQPQVLNGRSLRPLGSVLLEGHLVPQSRLEVAQNIQRMLRGVDLRYELGEILLMFKLLTPDQLLAATLVSHGLISTQQITALARIRQELHSIGLEYDLESLLILFRMLTPEQLREMRASWQG